MSTEQANAQLVDKNTSLASDNYDLADTVKKYEKFLAKPLKELFTEHEKLELAYKKQQEILLNWMASQTAFRFLAEKYGKETGLAKESIFLEAIELTPLYKEYMKKGGKI